jgi:pSer/pThr/pTyr-binding forkhead associated (FHA) protein
MPLLRAFLEIVDGPDKGRKIPLRDGQTLYVGRTDQADISCPANATMSSVHFSARWINGQCEIKDLNSANGTWRGGVKVSEAFLRPGEEIRAGKATFRLGVEDETGTLPTAPPADVPASEQDAGRGPAEVGRTTVVASAAAVPSPSATPLHLRRGAAILQTDVLPPAVSLGEAARRLLAEPMPIPASLDLLASREQFLDALRVVAYALTKRSAVEWALRCVRLAAGDDLSPQDREALDAAEAWVEQPEEGPRRRCEAAAAAAEHQTPAAWVATAAFWSGGSLAPPNVPAVPPGEHLTAHAACGAVMLAAVARQPEKAPQRYAQFLQIGKELLSTPAT